MRWISGGIDRAIVRLTFVVLASGRRPKNTKRTQEGGLGLKAHIDTYTRKLDALRV